MVMMGPATATTSIIIISEMRPYIFSCHISLRLVGGVQLPMKSDSAPVHSYCFPPALVVLSLARGLLPAVRWFGSIPTGWIGASGRWMVKAGGSLDCASRHFPMPPQPHPAISLHHNNLFGGRPYSSGSNGELRRIAVGAHPAVGGSLHAELLPYRAI